MFLRIFRYRVKPQMRDRHLALQARSAQLYGKYVSRAPSYFRRSGDANSWVELHWYADKAECQKVAQAVADDLELSRLWREFQDTLDPDQPPTLEEFNEYELPRPVNASPFSQPPIDDATPQPVRPMPVADPPVVHASDNGDGHAANEHANKDHAEKAPDAHVAELVERANEDEPAPRPMWPTPPLPSESQTDELVIEDEPPAEPPGTTLSFNDGVWIVEPEPKRRRDEG